MAKTLKFANVITCEHVVAGSMNKPTLIGVYSGDILIESFPAGITIGVYIEHIADPDQNGKIVLKQTISDENSDCVINFSENILDGVYFLEIVSKEKSVVKKVVLIR